MEYCFKIFWGCRVIPKRVKDLLLGWRNRCTFEDMECLREQLLQSFMGLCLIGHRFGDSHLVSPSQCFQIPFLLVHSFMSLFFIFVATSCFLPCCSLFYQYLILPIKKKNLGGEDNWLVTTLHEAEVTSSNLLLADSIAKCLTLQGFRSTIDTIGQKTVRVSQMWG